MQYLPHNPQQGAIQYLQLIPTRPLIVPISPYISSYNNPYSNGPSGQSSPYGPAAQATSLSPYGPAAQASSLSPYGPTAQASSLSPYGAPHHSYSQSPPSNSFGSSYAPSLQNPIGGYSTNYLTYFRPNNGMQLVNGPVDLSLNTNEYIPLQSENTYKMRRV